MTEIRVDVDLEQPPSVVWRALTEVHLVTDWLPTTRFMLRDNGTFTFQATGVEGLDAPIEGELVTAEAPHRLVMRWEGDKLHTVVAITIEPRDGGSHVTLTQSGFLGPQGTLRRRVLRATYTTLLEGPLKTTLAKIADSAPDEPQSSAPAAVPRRNDGGPFNRLPRQSNGPSRSAPGLSSHAAHSTAGPRPTTPVPGFAAAVLGARATGVAKVAAQPAPAPPPPQRAASRPAAVPTARIGTLVARGGTAVRDGWSWLARVRDWSADQRSQAVAAGAAALLLLAMIGLLIGKATALHPAGPPRVGGPNPGPAQASAPAATTGGGDPSPQSTPQPAAPPTTRAAAPSVTPSPGPPSAALNGAQLSAAYRTEDLSLTAYRVTVTIANHSDVTADDWALVIVLPLLDLNVRNVSGAVMTRTDVRAIFTPVDATRTVRPATGVTVRFDVEGLGVRNGPFTCTIDGRDCTRIPG